ncbi:MSP domain and CRAL-TRIO domain and PapD-like domain-containing protein [Strongyloides ratti]|uniref:MSP domain and CRAL-TRIO domain and PapD-like domain-containing protein n=1 Tax=Strongyloides ratti TaxID=34506 RepID=A0A090LHZ7_STRRB|nr:MSP domain and CRAL-TRIO domain and PapD-like domain-containing protein [Strongyloides ratti]CEF67135.1 MSP domain and CRAL-TRIO domain and PapD-like domain-containing protein [Strongyloides ratti]
MEIKKNTNDNINELKKNIINNPAFIKANKSDREIILNNDWYLENTLISRNYDLDVTQAVLLEALKWRSNINIKRVSILEFKSLLESQLMYFHGFDNNNNEILWINLTRFDNQSESIIKKLTIFFLERHYFMTKGAPIALMVNMYQASIYTLNIDFFKFLFNAFKYYYPNYLKSIYLFESSLLMQSTWRIIKSTFEKEQIDNFYTISGETINNYLPKKYIPTSFGGEDNYKFNMEDMAKYTSSHDCQTDSGYYETSTLEQQPHLNTSFVRKTVSFGGDDDEDVRRVSPLVMSSDGNNLMTSSQTSEGNFENNRNSSRIGLKNSKGQLPPSVPPRSNSVRKNNHIPLYLKPLVEEKINAPPDEWFTSDIIQMCPSTTISLKSVDNENDLVEIIVIKNVSNQNIFYKIRITSPEKFRVRPSTGILKPNSQEIIRLYLQNEYKTSISRDRFLLMAIAVNDNLKFEDFGKIWQESSDDKKVERKLTCKLKENLKNEQNFEQPISVLKKNSTIEFIKHQNNDISSLFFRQNIIIFAIGILIILQLIILLKLNTISFSTTTQLPSNEKCFSNDRNNLPEDEL